MHQVGQERAHDLGAGQPRQLERDPFGDRVYPPDQVARLKLIKQLLSEGWRAGAVVPLADSALHADQLDEAEALAARERAKEMLEGKHGAIDLARAQAELVEAEARYRAAQQLKGHRN